MTARLFPLLIVLGLAVSQVESQAQTPVVTIVRKTINPPGPAVGTNYQVTMEVQTREGGMVRGEIRVPPRDNVISQNPVDQYIAAGQSAVFSFNVHCGESGGLVQFHAQKIDAAPGIRLEATRDGRTANSSLADSDPRDAVRKASAAKIFQVQMRQGKTYVIDMVSTQLDPFLRLENAFGVQLAQDDDSGGFPNARIIFHAPEDGVYRVFATSFSPAVGGFTLLVREQ